MKSRLFVDTGAWYALQVPDDRWHKSARETLVSAVSRKSALVTSNHVIGETYTLLMKTHGNAVALRFVDTIGRSGRLEVMHLDEETEGEAWTVLRRFADQAVSFVDATSFALMRRERIRHAFAFDRHFSAAGFLRVPQEAPLP